MVRTVVEKELHLLSESEINALNNISKLSCGNCFHLPPDSC